MMNLDALADYLASNTNKLVTVGCFIQRNRGTHDRLSQFNARVGPIGELDSIFLVADTIDELRVKMMEAMGDKHAEERRQVFSIAEKAAQLGYELVKKQPTQEAK